MKKQQAKRGPRGKGQNLDDDLRSLRAHDSAASVVESADAVSDAGRGSATQMGLGHTLRDAARAVAQAEAALSDISDELYAAANITDRAIHEARVLQERAIYQAAAQQEAAIEVAQAAMKRAMAATSPSDPLGPGGVNPLQSHHRYGD